MTNNQQYFIYKYKEELIPYNIWADTFDTPFYNDMPYSLISTIRFMAELDIKDLIADDVHIVKVE